MRKTSWLLYLLLSLVLTSCFDSGSEESGGSGLFSGHREVEDGFSLSIPTSKVFSTGQNIDLVTTHPSVVTVTGNPRLQIDLGGSTVYATYLTGSGTQSLTFRYTVQSGDNDSDGIDITPSIDLNGATIQFSNSGVNTNANTEIFSPPSTAGLKVDTTSPSLTLVTPPNPDTYYFGQQVQFFAVFDDTVYVTGTPRITLNLNSGNVNVDYTTGSGTTTLFFKYTVGASDLDLDGITYTSPINLNGGTIKDKNGNSASLTFTPIPGPTTYIDGDSPRVLSYNYPTQKTYGLGETISFDLVFSEAVDVAGGTPTIDLDIGGITTQASYASGTGTDTLTFSYIVGQGLQDTNGIEIQDTIALNGATIRDSGALDADLSIAPSLTPNVLVDSRVPDVTAITAPADGNYTTGQNLDFVFQFDEDVVVTNTPRVEIQLSSGNIYANYLSGSGTNFLTFRYTVQASDNDEDGINFAASTIDLNTTGTISSLLTGYGANLSFSGLEPVMTAILVNSNPVTQMAITVQPVDSYKDQTITPAIQVELRDASNNLVTSATNSVTVSLGTDPSSGAATLGGTLTVSAVAGVATFSDLTLDDIQNGYTLSFASGSLTPVVSNSFNITQAPATQVVFTQDPTDALAGDILNPAITVELRDAAGNLVTSETSNVTLGIGTDPSSGNATLGGTITVAAVAGIATFNDITVDKAFSGYTLTASSGALTPGNSNSFNITPNIKTQLAFSVEPTDADVDTNISPSIEVQIQDAYGNVTTDTDSITLAINNNAGPGGTLSGTLTVAGTAGTASFNDINIDLAGVGYTLDATAAGLTTATSSAFNISQVPTQLIITQQPVDTEYNQSITPAITVEIQDASGNLVSASTDNVTVSFGTDPSAGTATLGGTLTVAAVGGIATFSDINIDTVNTGYTLSFSSGSLTAATSNTFDILTGTATQLVFTQEPTDALAGDNINPAITIELRDASNNIVSSETSNVTLAIGTDPSSGSATLGGTLTVAAVGGVATFSDINIDKAFTAYTLTASSGALTPGTSNSFNISPNIKSQLAFSVEPTDAEVDANISPSIEVEIQDAYGNKTVDTDTVTLAINNNAGPGGTLSGTLTVAAVNGVASFNDINIDIAGIGYTLDATAAGLTTATSSAFNISQVPTQLIITQQPTDAFNNIAIAPAITVEIRDASNNLVSASTDNITVSFGTDPSAGSATLGGTLTVAAVGGIATFSDLDIDTVNNGYSLSFSSGSLTGATSNTFNITQAPATQLAFVQEPTDAVAGVNISPSITVEFQDAAGNIVPTETSNVTLAFSTDPSAGAATLNGTLTVAAVNGIATFNDINIDKAFAGYTLSASSGALTPATSASFTISPSTATQLAFSVEPSDTAQDVAINPSIEVQIQDAYGNVTADTNTITLAINNNAGPGGTLSGTLALAAVAGTASFNDINIDVAGSGYTLDATAGGLTTATSSSFNITQVPTQLVITQQPTDAFNSVAISPAITVEIQDATGTLVSSATDNVTVTFGTDPSAGSATLGGTLTVAAVGGIATFSDLDIDTVNNGYTLSFSSGSLTGATSNTFNITQAPATQLVFTQEPTSTTAGTFINPAITIEIQDANGNLVSTATDIITLSLGTDPSAGSATLAGTLSVAATAGIATFNDINLDIANTGYGLTASAAGLTDATSNLFNISAGTKTQLAFSVEPTDVDANANISPSIEVEIQDAYGNKTSDTDTITLVINNNAGPGGTLSGTSSISAVNGTASFGDINIDIPGAGYTIDATAGGLTTATSTSFNVNSLATQLVITTQPSDAVVDASIAPAITIEMRDASNNLVTGNTDNVTVAISNDPTAGAASLAGTLTVSAVGGVATFSDLAIDTNASGYTLLFSSGSLTSATSNSFDINLPASLAFQDNTLYDFGQKSLGSSTDLTVVVEHSGSGTATITSSANPSADFTYKGGSFPGTGGTCTSTVSSNCIVVLSYAPTTTAVHSATLSISYNNGGSIETITKDLTGEGISDPPTRLEVLGTSGVITGDCIPFTIRSVTDAYNASNVSSNENISLVVNNGTGTFYSDAACTTSTTTTSISSGTSSQMIYFSTSTAGQSLTLIFNAATLANTSKLVISANEPIDIFASASPEVELGACSAIEVSLLDASGTKTGSSSAQQVNLSLSGSAQFFNDSFCTGSISSVNFSAYESTKYIYVQNNTAEQDTITFSDNAATLTSTTATIDFVPTLTWWNNSWLKRKKITLNNIDQATTFSDMPVLIKLNTARINYNDLIADGSDIRFTLDDHSTVLSHNIEHWNASGESFIWVKLPTIAASSEVNIYMYYNNSAATDADDANGVFSNYSGVWNMDKSGASYIDSTGSGKDGTNVGSLADVVGPAGMAVDFDGASELDTGFGLQKIIGKTSTLSLWVKTSQTGSNTNWQAPGITGVEEAGGGDDIFFGFLQADGSIAVNAGNAGVAASNFVINDNNWRHITIQRDQTNGDVRFYVNGVLNGSGTSESGYKKTAFTSFGVIADTGGTPNYFIGQMDGIRLTTGYSDPEVVKGEFKFQADTHVSFGTQEDL